jgi:hypothetical protein
MPTVHVEAEISRKELFDAAEQLSAPELAQFVSDLLALRARREARSLSTAESQALVQINQGLPEGLRSRYDELIAKRQAETLSDEELKQLLGLTHVVEDLQARRMDALAALARVRGVSLGALMNDLGITEPSDER